MKNVVLLVRRGPLTGSRLELELGSATIGREPGPGGVLLPGDSQVSRRHGELREEQGRIVYRNLSANGTLVDRRVVREATVLKPGTELRLGDEYLLEVQFTRERLTSTRAAGPAGSPWSRGPLAKPLVRIVLGVYLAGILGLVAVLALRGESSLTDEFAPVRARYLESYRPAGLSSAEKRQRLARADHLVRELAAREREERWSEAQAICRELMALDHAPASPIFKFGALQLGALAERE